MVGIARDYLASLDPFEVERLPEHCKPRKLFDAGDVAAYAFDLVRCHHAVDESAAIVHRVAAFFVHANTRLARIFWMTGEPGAGREQSA